MAAVLGESPPFFSISGTLSPFPLPLPVCVCVLSICERDKGSGRKHEQVGPWRIVPTKMLFFTLFERKLSDSRTPKKQRQQEHQAAQEEKVVSSK